MRKTKFNNEHVYPPVTEPEALDWLRTLTVNTPMPPDVMWRLAQAVRAIDMRLQEHECALLAAYHAELPR